MPVYVMCVVCKFSLWFFSDYSRMKKPLIIILHFASLFCVAFICLFLHIWILRLSLSLFILGNRSFLGTSSFDWRRSISRTIFRINTTRMRRTTDEIHSHDASRRSRFSDQSESNRLFVLNWFLLDELILLLMLSNWTISRSFVNFNRWKNGIYGALSPHNKLKALVFILFVFLLISVSFRSTFSSHCRICPKNILIFICKRRFWNKW